MLRSSQFYCRIIATAAKHSECRFWAEVDFAADTRVGPAFRLAGMPASPPQRRWVLKLDVGNARIPALDVFDTVLTFWTEFIHGRQIGRD